MIPLYELFISSIVTVLTSSSTSLHWQSAPQQISTIQLPNNFKMCWHSRVVYSCAHYGWSAKRADCTLQKNFDSGSSLVSCHIMNSHPIHSIRVQIPCSDCQRKILNTRTTVTKAKDILVSLNSTIERLQGGPKKNRVSQISAGGTA